MNLILIITNRDEPVYAKDLNDLSNEEIKGILYQYKNFYNITFLQNIEDFDKYSDPSPRIVLFLGFYQIDDEEYTLSIIKIKKK